jgi:hypothetical protein
MSTERTATTMSTRPSVHRSLAALLLCLCLCQQQCLSFQQVSRSKTSRSAPLSPLPRPIPHHQWLASRSTLRQEQILIAALRQASSDDEAAEAANTEKAAAGTPPQETNADSSLEPKKKSSGVWWKTAALALPLFCKFVIVLVIKFLTDLVVYPLLLLYRLARLTKRRILGLFSSKGKDEKVNGSSSL